MTVLNFPPQPQNIGNTYVGPNGSTYRWDGAKWNGVSIPAYKLVNNGYIFELDSTGNLTLPAGGTINWSDGSNALVGGGTANLGNYTFNADQFLMPDSAQLNSGGIGITNAAEFGTEVSRDGGGNIDGSQIYMGAGTAETRAIVDSSGSSLIYTGVENVELPGFAGAVAIDPNVTSMYAIGIDGNNNIILGATQMGGTLTTTGYTAGLGVLNSSLNMNGIYADANVAVISGLNGVTLQTAGQYSWFLDTDGVLNTPNNASITSQQSLYLSADGGEGQLYGSGGTWLHSGSEGYVYLSVDSATGMYGQAAGGEVLIGSGSGADGGEGGPVVTYAGVGSGNTVTHAGGVGGGIWIYGGEGALTLDGSEYAAIANISLSSDSVTVNIPNHHLSQHDVLYLSGITTTTQLNDTTYRVSVIDSGNVQLYYDTALTQPVSGTGFTTYDNGGGVAYHSTRGGDIMLFPGSPSNNAYGDYGSVVFGGNLVPSNDTAPLTIENNYNYWQFKSDGTAQFPGGVAFNPEWFFLGAGSEGDPGNSFIYGDQGNGLYFGVNGGQYYWTMGGEGIPNQFTLPDYFSNLMPGNLVTSTTNISVAGGDTVTWSNATPFGSTMNGSIEFDGGAGLTITPATQPLAWGPYTISLWFYPTAMQNGTTLVGGDNSPNLYMQNLNDVLITTGDGYNAAGFSFDTTLSLNTWYHLVVTRDSTGRCQAWLNGAYLSVAGAYKQIDNHNYTQGTSQIGAGTYYSGTFIGLITDVKIDNANLYSTWGPGNNGNIPVPTAPATPGYSTQLLLSAASNAAVFTNNALDVTYTPMTVNSLFTQVGIGTTGTVYMPPTPNGNVSITGTATTVGGVYPAWSTANTTTIIWQASSTDVTGFRMTVRAQHNDPSTCVEMADITAALDNNGGLFYSVGNRVKSNVLAQDTGFGVEVITGFLTTGDVMTVNAAVGSDTVYFTYQVTEFMKSHAN